MPSPRVVLLVGPVLLHLQLLQLLLLLLLLQRLRRLRCPRRVLLHPRPRRSRLDSVRRRRLLRSEGDRRWVGSHGLLTSVAVRDRDDSMVWSRRGGHRSRDDSRCALCKRRRRTCRQEIRVQRHQWSRRTAFLIWTVRGGGGGGGAVMGRGRYRSSHTHHGTGNVCAACMHNCRCVSSTWRRERACVADCGDVGSDAGTRWKRRRQLDCRARRALLHGTCRATTGS